MMEFGIEPFKLLKLKFKYLRLVRFFKSGIAPEMELFWRYNQVSLLRFWKVVGILPEKLLEEISNAMSLGEIVEGIRPEKLFCCRFTYWSEGMERMSEGRFPLRPLEWRLRILRESRFPLSFLLGTVWPSNCIVSLSLLILIYLVEVLLEL